MDKFTCAACGGEFESAWTEEEAEAEAAVHGFDVVPLEDRVLVCDECFPQIMEFNNHPIGEHRDC